VIRVRLVGGPWDGRVEEHASRPAMLIRFDPDPAEHAEAAEVYLYVDAGDDSAGAVFELERTD
jgi:hypothetical protein